LAAGGSVQWIIVSCGRRWIPLVAEGINDFFGCGCRMISLVAGNGFFCRQQAEVGFIRPQWIRLAAGSSVR